MNTIQVYTISLIGSLLILITGNLNAGLKRYYEKQDQSGYSIALNKHIAWIYIDTTIGDYWIRCVAIDNQNTDNPEKDDYLDRQLVIDMKYKQNHYRKKLTRFSVERLVPSLDIKNNVLVSMSFTRITNSGVYLLFNLCVPDSDVCDDFELNISPQGKTRIRYYLLPYNPVFETKGIAPLFDTIKY